MVWQGPFSIISTCTNYMWHSVFDLRKALNAELLLKVEYFTSGIAASAEVKDLMMWTWVSNSSCFHFTMETLFNENSESHNKASLRPPDFSDHIWDGSGQTTGRSTSKYETCRFLLPEGGAISVIQYWTVNVLRPGLLSNVKFRADWAMYVWVTTTSCFTEKHQNSPYRDGHAVQRKLKSFTV